MPTVNSASLGIKGGGWAAGAAGDVASAAVNYGISKIKSGGDNSDFVKHPLVKMVKDAQRAGIHPLYALGAGANYSPMLNVGRDTGPQTFARDLVRGTAERAARTDSGDPSVLDQAQLMALRASAERDHAAALLSNSEEALNRQKFNGQPAVIPEYIRRPGSFVGSRPGDPLTQATPSQAPFIEVAAPWGGTTRIIDQNVSDAELPGDIIQAFQWYNEAKAKLAEKIREPANSSTMARRAQTQRAIKEAQDALARGWQTLKQRFLNEIHRTK
ncbi:MAG: DNA pilot protein [Microvirus sp.]|nr:MAG: DNA pilot protein [Microvirus sp.]